jgi:hypothetical protein
LAQYDYNVSGNCYVSDNSIILATANKDDTQYVYDKNKKLYTYYNIITIDEDYALTENEFLAKKF